jgi:6-pyruvoyltetrahydropterin/6-carboxytetrahydropterin synthase
MMRVTRRYRFSASHRLHSDRFTEAENRALYGKCNNPYGHGHDYVLEVTVAGPVDAATGLVVHVPSLDALVTSKVLRDFDHRNFNVDVAEFQELAPTSENIIAVIDERLRANWEDSFSGPWPRLEGIRLQETKRNRFELQDSAPAREARRSGEATR